MKTIELTAFLGPIGGPEIIMIFVVLLLLAFPVVIVFGVLMYSKFRNKASGVRIPPISVQSRLAEIDVLRSQNVITESEYDEKRKQIISEL